MNTGAGQEEGRTKTLMSHANACQPIGYTIDVYGDFTEVVRIGNEIRIRPIDVEGFAARPHQDGWRIELDVRASSTQLTTLRRRLEHMPTVAWVRSRDHPYPPRNGEP